MNQFSEAFSDEFSNDSPDSDDNEESLKKKKASSEFAKLLEDSFQNTKKKVSPGDKIRSEILSIGKDDVYVSTGTVHDGLVSKKDLLDGDGTLKHKVGDRIDLYVTRVKGSEIYLSPKPTAKNLADNLEDAFDMMTPVEGRVVEVCKGGFRVNVSGKIAFCPISQMDIKRIETPEEYIGKRGEFMITQFSERGRNIVVSRRKVLEEQRQLSEAAFAEENKSGDVLKGKITRLEKFGAFVEMESGLEGLIHISELSWSRVENPQDIVSVGQEVVVKVLRTEEKDGKLKIALSLKQAGAEPWLNLDSQIKVGQVVPGKVKRCMKFGAFVELAPGVEGLIPLSEMSYTKRVVRSDELIKEGESITVMIKEINSEDHRILLSLKDAGADPWAMASQKFAVGRVFKGKVERKEPYGVFVQLEEGVTGLLPKSKIQEDSQIHFEKIRVGDEIAVQVGELKLEERKISLTTPQDPNQDEWKKFTPASSGSFGTLGDQLQKAMQQKKKK